VLNSLAGIQNPGNDVILTLDSRLQRATQNALYGYNGAAVVLDAYTGEALAIASAPTYDLNQADALLESLEQAGAYDSGVLFNRATQGLYPPGSTFKMVTLTGALYSSGVSLADTYASPSTITIGGAPITNFNNNDYGTVTVQRAFELSSNTVFAQLADNMGPYTLVSTASSFGFGRSLGQDFSVATSLMPDPSVMTEWETAWAGAGEPVGEHRDSPAGPQVTAVQMALVGATFANNGTMMNPYVVDSVLASNGSVLSRTRPEVFGNVASAQVIADVQMAMEGVVSSGTGYAAQIQGYVVRGKSGTAETGRYEDDSWFVGYVEVGGRSIVVAIVLEEAGEGAATPRARDILLAAVELYG